MKPLIQKIILDEGTSFVARVYETPAWEVPWHQHEEAELVVIQNSSGTMFAGNYIGEYKEGDVFFFGKNLPHGFQKRYEKMAGSAMVVQFKEDLFGDTFLALPELGNVKKLLLKTRQGMQLKGKLREELGGMLQQMEHQKGIETILSLISCLFRISISDEAEVLTSADFHPVSKGDQDKIGIVFEYTMKHFAEGITLQDMADLTHYSVAGFCRYFKRTTQKTYIEFLNEIKIDHACKLLRDSDKTISEICYESGFTSWANFSKQFKKICGLPPSQYRRVYRVI